MPDTLPPGGRLGLNIMQFCRVLRAAGLPIGPGKVLQALEAVRTVGVGSRADLYWTLHAALINRRDQRDLYDQAFHIFWRNPDLLKRAMALMLPQIDTGKDEDREQVMRRLAEALQDPSKPGGDQGRQPPEPPELEVDATLTFSEKEVLQSIDFEQMSVEELAQARRAIAELRLPVRPMPMRRFQVSDNGARIDLRRTLRRSLRGGGATIDLVRKTRRYRTPPIVALCDISGSMSRYSRMLLHFLHAVTSDRDRVHSFVFGTRLTNVTRYLRYRDVDLALDHVAEAVEDWSGGTRIGSCLHEFNRWWSRRVLGQGAVVLLITDGLDRDTANSLEPEIERLHKSCRRLIWLNPLLRYDEYAPKSLGARQLMPHCDDFRPVHNLQSLADLAEVLSRQAPPADARMDRWRALAAA